MAELRSGAEVRWEDEGERISEVDERVTSSMMVKRNGSSGRTAHIGRPTHSNIHRNSVPLKTTWESIGPHETALVSGRAYEGFLR